MFTIYSFTFIGVFQCIFIKKYLYLDGTSEDVPVVGQPRGERGAIVEGVLGFSLGLLQRGGKSI